MANISDVYEIQFEASTEELAKKLETYLKEIEIDDPYYGTTTGVKRSGKVLNGGYVQGRWTYSNNLDGTFTRPEQWLGVYRKGLKEAWEAVLEQLKRGGVISVSWSEDEPGCEVYQDGSADISYENGKVEIVYSFSDHDKPDCEILDGFCYDHEVDVPEGTERYCEVAE